MALMRCCTWLILSGVLMAQELEVDIKVREKETSIQAEALMSVEQVPVSDELAANLFDRLTPLPVEDPVGDVVIRERSVPAPRPGESVPLLFDEPSLEAPIADDGRPFNVVRYAPQGERGLATQVQIAFSRDVVPLTTLDQLDLRQAPATIDPQPQGRWRWVDPRTLLFDGESVFPRSTRYRVEVQPNLTALDGAILENPVAWEFTTPALKVVRSFPQGIGHELNPLIGLEFDQAIDRLALSRALELRGGNHIVELQTLAVEDLTEVEQKRVKGWTVERLMLFKPVRPLAPDTEYRITLPRGSYSTEGPLFSDNDHAFVFRTYGSFAMTRSVCGWQDRCEPGWPWRIEFTNEIDPKTVSAQIVHVEPPIEDLVLTAHGNTLALHGRSQGRITYQVTLERDLKDRFGQSLAKKTTTRFKVGPAQPQMRPSLGPMKVLDPFVERTLPIACVNIKSFRVNAYAVDARDWSAYRLWMKNHQAGKAGRPKFGEHIAEMVVAGPDVLDQWTFASLSLDPWLSDGKGQLVLSIKPEESSPGTRIQARDYEETTWVQATHLAVDAFHDGSRLVAWVTNLETGDPVSGAQVRLWTGSPGSERASALSDERGLAYLKPPTTLTGPAWLTAEHEGDQVFLPENLYWWSDHTNWAKRSTRSNTYWYVFDDRGIYKPGESGEIKGWLRTAHQERPSKLGLASGRVSYQLRDPRGDELVKGELELNELGGFHLRFELPDTVNLGSAQLLLSHDAGNHTHFIRIDEFRRPEFEVSIDRNQASAMLGDELDLTVHAKYYSGPGLAAAPVDWQVHADRTQYRPPNWPDYVFGEPRPWWIWGDDKTTGEAYLQGVTAGDGKHTMGLLVDVLDPPQPLNVTVNAAVTDLNRQRWDDSQSFILHPADHYVGLRCDRGYYQAGATMAGSMVVTDLDGTTVSNGRIEFEVTRGQWRYIDQQWKEEVQPIKSFVLKCDKQPVPFKLELEQPGSYKVRARVVDDQDRANETVLSVWVAGGTSPPTRSGDTGSVVMIPDQAQYQTGDTASLYLRLPFERGQGTVFVFGNGVREIPFDCDAGEVTVEVPVGPDPRDLAVHVLFAGAAERDASGKHPPIPKSARGQIILPVVKDRQRLRVEVTTDKTKAPPGSEVEVQVRVVNDRGDPASQAEVCLFAVDEAVLGLSNYHLQDPVQTFFPSGALSGDTHLLRSWVLVVTSEMLAAEEEVPRRQSMRAPASAPMEADMMVLEESLAGSQAPGSSFDAQPIRVRKWFDALAFFEPSMRTRSDGSLVYRFKLPDSTTRYRVMAVVVRGNDHFGAGESSLTAQLPLIVRPSLPRFLNYGDRVELPVLIQNTTEDSMDVLVGLRSSGSLKVAHNAYQVSLGPEQRTEVLFPAQTRAAGQAHIQIAATSANWADAVELPLPIWTPATREGFAYYGSLEAGEAGFHGMEAPDDVLLDYGGLDVSLSSTQLHMLSDAIVYLVDYPFACTEQLASRVLGVITVQDLIAAFDASRLPSPDKLRLRVQEDLGLIEARQNNDGGFAFWRRQQESDPYLSVHASFALTLAKKQGYLVEDQVMNQASAFLRRIARNKLQRPVSNITRAYAVFVLAQAGQSVDQEIDLLLRQPLTDWNVDALAFVSLACKKGSQQQGQVSDELSGRVRETAATAEFVHRVLQEAPVVLASDRRSDALGMWAALESGTDDALILKLVRGLMAHRVKGRWSNTQENVFVLLALTQYFERYEAVEPDLLARVWIGDQQIADQPFVGRQVIRAEKRIPMQWVADADRTLTLAANGQGRLFYRLGLDYAPASLVLEPLRQGFSVSRTYEAIEEGDVRRREDGSWWVRSGAEVRVRVTMVAPEARYHVALVDALPAGLEAGSLEQPAWVSRNPLAYRFSWGAWYEHQNIRDERVEAFASRLGGGVYEIVYRARATTPGDFVVPPARAEEMYAPETFGRSSTDRLTVSPEF